MYTYKNIQYIHDIHTSSSEIIQEHVPTATNMHFLFHEYVEGVQKIKELT